MADSSDNPPVADNGAEQRKPSSRERLKILFKTALQARQPQAPEQIELEIDSIVSDIEAEALKKEGFEEFTLDYLADKQAVISDALVMKSQGLNRNEE